MTAHLRPKALGDYKVRDLRMLIDGAWVEGASGRTLERIAPGHYAIGPVRHGGCGRGK